MYRGLSLLLVAVVLSAVPAPAPGQVPIPESFRFPALSPEPGLEFGELVTLDRNTAVVRQGLDRLLVYRRQHDRSWELEGDLAVTIGNIADIAISGSTLVVGVQYPNDGFDGSLLVFQRNETGSPPWIDVARIEGGFRFGAAVDIDRNRLAGGQPANGGADIGGVALLDRDPVDPRSWNVEANFNTGEVVAILADRVVVGGPDAGGFGEFTGQIADYSRDEGGPGEWGRVRWILDPFEEQGERFGREVALSHNIVMGTGNDPSTDQLVFWDEFEWEYWGELNGREARQRLTDEWVIVNEFVNEVLFTNPTYEMAPTDGMEGDRFAEGDSVSISGESVLVGAPGHDADTGAAYLFEISSVAPLLTLSGPCPGTVEMELSGATPSGDVSLVRGSGLASTYAEDSTCPLTLLDLAEPIPFVRVTADAEGRIAHRRSLGGLRNPDSGDRHGELPRERRGLGGRSGPTPGLVRNGDAGGQSRRGHGRRGRSRLRHLVGRGYVW